MNDRKLSEAVEQHRSGNFDRAESMVRDVLRQEPNHPDALHLLGVLAQQTGRAELAIQSIAKAMEIHTRDPRFYYNLAGTLRGRGRADEAIAHYQRALELDPTFAAAWLSLGAVQFEQGRLSEALASFDQGLALKPHDAQARLIRGMIYLQAGDFAQGWREFEWRRAEMAGSTVSPLPIPYWSGESLAGKTLLVEPEQSLADQIMFASCLPDVLALADRVVIASDPRLLTIFSRSFPAARVIHAAAHRRAAESLSGEQACRVALGSLPRHLRCGEECFPRHGGYLAADRQMRHGWWRRLSSISDLPKVGFAWRGNGPLSDERSTRLEQWTRLLSPQLATFVSLQTGDCHDELAAFCSKHGVTIHCWPEIAAEENLDQQAALISALDLVISVPNTIVHLAGALGIETWNLLAWSSSWRWMLRRDDSPWYPSMRLFRPFRPGDWDGVFDRLQRELRGQWSRSPSLRGPHRRATAPRMLPHTS